MAKLTKKSKKSVEPALGVMDYADMPIEVMVECADMTLSNYVSAPDMGHVESTVTWVDGPEPELDVEPGSEEVPVAKVNELFNLSLTRTQLIHIRDLFSVLLSFEDEVSLSAALAVKENRELAEARLWNKIGELCESADIVLDETAPDFVVGLSKNPELTIFTLHPEDLSEPEEE